MSWYFLSNADQIIKQKVLLNSIGEKAWNNISPAQTIRFTRGDRTAAGHEVVVTYIVEVDT